MLRKILDKLRRKQLYIYKSAINGKIVSKAFAEAHPDSCYKMLVKPK